jgi:hypothetical protein
MSPAHEFALNEVTAFCVAEYCSSKDLITGLEVNRDTCEL